MASSKRPNIVLLITDQQRTPMHWPEEPGWLEALTPNDAELRRTGVSFTQACTASAMCSPSRASFLTGTYPSRHGVTLTLTTGDLQPDPRYLPAILREVSGMAASGVVPRGRLAENFARGLLRLGPAGGGEPELPAGIPTLGTRLRDAGYTVVYKGKWHLTAPLAGAHDWGAADAERLERDHGFGGWEPPDAGENTDADHFGGGTAGRSSAGWDEDYTRQVEAFLAHADLPEPFCLIVSLVNPHDVLGYPSSYAAGGYRRDDFAGLGVQLPPSVDESLDEKPAVHSLMRLGQTSYIGALGTREEQLDYVNFYAYLQGVVDEKIGRLLRALGDADDPSSLRSRTVIARISDHGEMGLSHGGLRQKMFNAYEETLRVPLVFSSPLLFTGGAESDAPASLVDLVPTLLGLAGAPADGTLDGANLCGVLARHAAPDRYAVRAAGVDFGGVLDAAPAHAAGEHVLFTFDDHQAGTARQEVAGQPNRVRCVRERRWKYAVYLDPAGRVAPEYELYDMEADPDETLNLVGVRSGRGRTRAAERERRRLHEALADACARTQTPVPGLTR
ncbi:MAG TPA: sulfatase-like hydrolase/transferase [Solirubrobacteraceae bacterium]|nr:sulfatase-like hydrolase/transferase [Solirubrobacteraceae bacterium]